MTRRLPENGARRDGAGGQRRATPVSSLLPGVLKSLGVASETVSRQVRAAWDLAADPAWRGRAEPQSVSGGWLLVAVPSSSLRQELSQFHRERLFRVVQAALPSVPLVGIRFIDGRTRDADAAVEPTDATAASTRRDVRQENR
jgi:hypothetical protein